MEDTNASQAVPPNPDRVPSAQTPLGKPEGQPPTEPCKRDTVSDQRTAQELDQIKKGEGWLIRVGIAGVVVNAVLGWIYWQQLYEMRRATEASTRAVDLARETLEYNASQFDREMRQTITQTGLQYRTTEEAITAANAAKGQLQTMQNEIELSQRPRVTITPYFDRPIHVYNVGTFATVDMVGGARFKNEGHSPATIYTFGVTIAKQPRPYTSRKTNCDVKIDNREPFEDVLPDREIARVGSAQLDSRDYPTPYQIFPFLEVCAAYQSSFTPTKMYYYQASFTVFHKGTGRNEFEGIPLNVDSIPPSELTTILVPGSTHEWTEPYAPKNAKKH